jgi:hypothetical protein
LAFTTFGTGFSIGYAILRFLRFSIRPWHGSISQPRPFIVNWILFVVCLVALPIGSIIIPFLLGRTGQFNSSYEAWNTACEDAKFTSKFHIKYVSSIGNAFSLTMYARGSQGIYYYLGLLPTTAPANKQVNITTPNFILFPTTNPTTSDVSAGQTIFTIATNNRDQSSKELIATLSLNMAGADNQSIVGWCVNATDPSGQPFICLNGALIAGTEEIAKDSTSGNRSLTEDINRTRTLQVMYDVLAAGTNSSNTTSLNGYLNSWPSYGENYMPNGVASQTTPSGYLELSSVGVVLDNAGVQVVNSPWPGCDGLMVCATQGINGMIAAGWIWENLNQWMWYSPNDCSM